MSKRFSFFVVAALVFSLAGCSETKPTTPPTTQKAAPTSKGVNEEGGARKSGPPQ